jgi:hypothetical protein
MIAADVTVIVKIVSPLLFLFGLLSSLPLFNILISTDDSWIEGIECVDNKEQ